jgi:hypothetical protein
LIWINETWRFYNECIVRWWCVRVASNPAQVQGRAAAGPAQVQVDLLRGLADIFSRGMDTLAAKLNQ